MRIAAAAEAAAAAAARARIAAIAEAAVVRERAVVAAAALATRNAAMAQSAAAAALARNTATRAAAGWRSVSLIPNRGLFSSQATLQAERMTQSVMLAQASRSSGTAVVGAASGTSVGAGPVIGNLQRSLLSQRASLFRARIGLARGKTAEEVAFAIHANEQRLGQSVMLQRRAHVRRVYLFRQRQLARVRAQNVFQHRRDQLTSVLENRQIANDNAIERIGLRARKTGGNDPGDGGNSPGGNGPGGGDGRFPNRRAANDNVKGAPTGTRLNIVETTRKFSKDEFRMAQYLADNGRIVEARALVKGRSADALVDGQVTEFKTAQRGATSNTIRNQVKKSLDRGGQAPNIISDARGSGLLSALT